MRSVLRAAAGPLTALGLVAAATACGSGDGASRYDVSVQFTGEATLEEMDEAAAFLRAFDDDLDFLIMEIFPPKGRAEVSTEAPGFCDTVSAELGDRSYVDDVSCGPADAGDSADPDAPVSHSAD